jgi:iron complex outermembrane receptor protein
MPPPLPPRCRTIALALSAVLGQAVPAAELADLELEQLREVVVTTVSRRAEPLDRAAASVTVISREDIRRSGATSLPEALRLATPLNVVQVDANQWTVSARGFSSLLANKLLVLIDGRTVYTPLFSGVWWDMQDVMLDDVERIEVITGPSTALWGSNAVNGLIHIITRSAADTQGTLAAVDIGQAGERHAALRHGSRSGAGGIVWRFYGKADKRPALRSAQGRSLQDDSERLQAGFRVEWSGARDSLLLQGDAYRATIGQVDIGPRRLVGANLVGRWERRLGSERSATVQLVLDHTERDQSPLFSERLDTMDLVAQVALPWGARQRWVVGGGVRSADDRTTGSSNFAFDPVERRLNWWRLFAQDQIRLGERWELGLSASVERNPYTGVEVLPSLRLGWAGERAGLWWLALSRAVRAPARVDRELFIPAQPPFLLAGGPNFVSEVSNVLEIGTRGQATPRLSYALTVFHHQHERQRSVGITDGRREIRNDIEGHSTGAEYSLQWRLLDRWRLHGGGVALRQRLRVKPGFADFGGLAALGNDPSHWWQLRSALDLGPRWGNGTWDLGVRRVGALVTPAVPSYTAVDTRLAWPLRRDLEVALVLRNLFDRGHPESGSSNLRAEIERSALLQLRWQP